MSFYNEISKYNWEQVNHSILAKTAGDVEKALSTLKPDLEDFKALISPAGAPYLETIAQKSMEITRKRFGKTIQMYIPLYLSNACNNTCIYCGFNHKNEFKRSILSKEDVLNEVAQIQKMGFEHILLVTGEDNKLCGVEYIKEIMHSIKKEFSLISLEIQPLDTPEYKELIGEGLNTVYIYQETYNESQYKKYHPGGKKSNYKYRLETPDRLGQAGVHKIGLGSLLGLEDWRTDSFFTALHMQYLEKKYWKSKYSISFPRLRPHSGSFEPENPVSAKQLMQLICAYRILNEHVELSLSTREAPAFRDHALKLGPTSYSAGSKTNPGGYTNSDESLEQFSVHDNRSPQEISEMIKANGYEVVWKDWDHFMQETLV